MKIIKMNKIWKNISEDYPNLNITKLDLDMDKEESDKYNPGNILPVTIFLDEDNNELERLIGEQKEDILRKTIDKYK